MLYHNFFSIMPFGHCKLFLNGYKILNYLMFQLPRSTIRSTYFFCIIMKAFFFNLCPLKPVIYTELWLPQWLKSKESDCNAGDPRDMGSVPGLGRSPVGMHGNPLQHFYLEKPMDRGAWQATVHGEAESNMTEVT